MENSINHNPLFKGFQNTPLLWHADTVEGLQQFPIIPTHKTFVPFSKTTQLRLGKWVEAYVNFQLKQDLNITILEENLQIRDHHKTIGELDLLFLNNTQPIHLEIAYKFYLYDTLNTYENPLEYWIGPNRNDSLIYKLKKLKERQLPLLYHSATKTILNNKNLSPETFTQCMHFKAQLFLPFNATAIDMSFLNNNCIEGFYLSFNALQQLNSYQFYIPQKLEWLSHPKLEVNWLSFAQAQQAIPAFIDQKQSPLCWIKSNTNTVKKCFITWW